MTSISILHTLTYAMHTYADHDDELISHMFTYMRTHTHTLTWSFCTDQNVHCFCRGNVWYSISHTEVDEAIFDHLYKSHSTVYFCIFAFLLYFVFSIICLPFLSMQLPWHPSTWPFLLGVSSMTVSHWLGLPLSTPMVLSCSISCSSRLLVGTSLSTPLTTPPQQCCLTWPLVPSTISQWGPSLWPLDHSVLRSSYTLLTVRIHAAPFVTGESALLYHGDWIEEVNVIALLFLLSPSFSALSATRCQCHQQWFHHCFGNLDGTCSVFPWALTTAMYLSGRWHAIVQYAS